MKILTAFLNIIRRANVMVDVLSKKLHVFLSHLRIVRFLLVYELRITRMGLSEETDLLGDFILWLVSI